MISHQYHCIFIHIPKTGGSSVEDVIWPGRRSESDLWMGFTRPMHNKYQTGGLPHLLSRQIRTEVGDGVFDQYFKFSFVRNPWDRVVSQYAYLASRPDLRDYIGMRADAPIAEYLDLIERREHVQWMRQVDFLTDDSGEIVVDFIGRFETLERDAREVFASIGVPDPMLRRTNASSRLEDFRQYFDADTRRTVARLYAADIEAFGYEFEKSDPGAPPYVKRIPPKARGRS